jgi:hypothetical protein
MSVDAEAVSISVPKALTHHARELVQSRYPGISEEELQRCVTAYVMGYMDFLLVQHRVFSEVGRASAVGGAAGVGP